MIRILCLIALLLPVPSFASEIRLKDLVNFSGVRSNDLIGYGIVIGLNGSGDSMRSAPFTAERLAGMLGQFGVAVDPLAIKPKNVAAVLVTARLHAFARSGDTIDIKVAAIGDAKSLQGGILVMTTLSGADGQIYAVAQGNVIADGFSAEGRRETLIEGVPTAGAIPEGARVEREVSFEFEDMSQLTLSLRRPDFGTAIRIEEAINAKVGLRMATAVDSGTIQISRELAPNERLSSLVARIENLPILADGTARVVVDPGSGTVVIDPNVRISTVAVAHGALSVRVTEMDMVSQPNPFSEGETITVPTSSISATQGEGGTQLVQLAGTASLEDLVEGLNALGVKPSDLIQILKTIDAAGALHGELIVE